jgi:chromosome segregation ATPase
MDAGRPSCDPVAPDVWDELGDLRAEIRERTTAIAKYISRNKEKESGSDCFSRLQTLYSIFQRQSTVNLGLRHELLSEKAQDISPELASLPHTVANFLAKVECLTGITVPDLDFATSCLEKSVRLERKTRDAHGELSRLDGQIESLRAEVRIAKEDLVSAREIAAQKDSERALTFAESQAKLERSLESSCAIQRRVSDCENQGDSLARDIAGLEGRAKPLREQITTQEKVVQEAVTAFRRLSERRNRQLDELVQGAREWETEHTRSRQGIQGLEKAVEYARAELETAQKQSQKDIEVLHAEIASLQRQVVEANSKLEMLAPTKKECCDRRESMKRKYQAARSEWEQFQQQTKACSRSMRTIESKLAKQNADIEGNKKKILAYAQTAGSEIEDIARGHNYAYESALVEHKTLESQIRVKTAEFERLSRENSALAGDLPDQSGRR